MDWREENKLKQKAQEYYEKEFSYNQVYIQGYSDGYAMAIDEFARFMSEYIDKNQYGCVDDLLDRPYTTMLEIAEQMKAGE